MNDSPDQATRDQGKTYVQVGLGLLGIAVTLFLAGGGASGA
jgi:hypothetical protein